MTRRTHALLSCGAIVLIGCSDTLTIKTTSAKPAASAAPGDASTGDAGAEESDGGSVDAHADDAGPARCGEDKNGCAFENADGYCSSDVCRLGACHDGFVDRDRDSANGCECKVTEEICNGVDDDCDGTVDEGFSLSHDPLNCGACDNRCDLAHATSACVESVCKIVACDVGYSDFDRDARTGCEAASCDVEGAIEPAADAGKDLPLGCDLPLKNGIPQGSCSDFARCTVDGSGGVDFEYNGCVNGKAVTFVACELTRAFDVTSFDEAFGGDRLAEVRLSVTREQKGALNLWYGRHPLRKYLPLLSGGAATPGCSTLRYFAGVDARYPTWCGIPVSCISPAPAEPGSTCPGTGCESDLRAVTRRWADGDPDPTCFQAGRAPDTDLDQFDFSHTPLNLVAEWADGVCLSGAVHLGAIQLLRKSCRCGEDSQCAGNPGRASCNSLDAYACAPDTRASAGRGGVCGSARGCADPPVPGSVCEIITGTASYAGTIRCDQGVCACRIE